jgi:hypothetical protein
MSKKTRFPREILAAAAGVIVAGLVACGESVPTASRVPFAGNSGPSIVMSQTLTGVAAGTDQLLAFTVPGQGTLVVTLRWKDASNSVIGILTDSECFNVHGASGDCRAQRSSRRPRQDGGEESIEQPGASGGYVLSVQNLGPGAESIEVTAEVTPPSTPPSSPIPRPSHRPTPEPNIPRHDR